LFHLFQGGSYECCYKTAVGKALLVSGIKAYRQGAGFYIVSKTLDDQMKHVCCTQTMSNYFCSMYAERRRPTTFLQYRNPIRGNLCFLLKALMLMCLSLSTTSADFRNEMKL